MKIGITCQATVGGSGVLAAELGFALAQRGHEVHFVTLEEPFRLGRFIPNLYTHHVETISYPLFKIPPYSIALSSKIAEVAEEYDIQVWHSHYAMPNSVAALVGRDMLPREKQFCLITTLHGTDITLVGTHPSFYRATRYVMENSCAVTAVSKWLSQQTENEFQLTQPVQTIYNFVDMDRFCDQPADRIALAAPNEKILMHISNFRPVKRVTDVVRVFGKVLEKMPARLIMIGDGPERLSATGVAKQLGIQDKIQYLGNCDNIECLLATADLLLQPSEHESFGLVPLEAMASEVPVIVTRSGGVTEVVRHGESGFLCEVGDIESMALHAIKILSDPVLAKQMGQRGRKVAATEFGREKIVDQYEALYEEILARRANMPHPEGHLPGMPK
ncbi:MAG: N-acetyl-alpha-D-glucosaminyl L-malate synthase BshA [Candidatus Hydrogenedentes bacterium]|jgi:N-acetyl-alpha-D-glucosaminyl L-malate synthase BshA|nr:N-acetyl-alpha-D-glucosaminyl L-malate synthase BshA [Candidatus Hydrogenedentota bacterium]